MTPSLRTARACHAAAALLVAAAAYAATRHSWLALPGLYTAAVFAWCAAREGAEHRRRVARARRAELLARPAGQADPFAHGLEPCCAFWRHSDGVVHGPECLGPAAAPVPLAEDCCERWWISLGARHDAGCRRHAGAPGRARPASQ
ncbi:hypothetical protein [Streptomyces sp. NPDC088935]|uniref:hypothetical protein n=1 Tax=Streptomyces sp. NPDC088935 TaxID=3365916 RepID=UPI00382680A0